MKMKQEVIEIIERRRSLLQDIKYACIERSFEPDLAQWVIKCRQCPLCRVKITENTKEGYTALPNYRSIILRFNNGQKHESAVCSSCSRKLNLDIAEQVYQSDLYEWNQDIELSPVKVSIHPQCFEREIIGIEV